MDYPTMTCTILFRENGISSPVELGESPQSVIFALCSWRMGQSYLNEYGGWSSGDPFGHLIHYDLECCIAELWFKVFLPRRKR